jgi:TatD family hydrolase
MKIYDSHAHLDLFLQKLGALEGDRGIDIETISQSQLSKISYDPKVLEQHIYNHELIIQPGISTENFYLNYHLFSHDMRITFLLGSHPDMVNQYFDVKKYLEKQQQAVNFVVENQLIEKKKLIGIGEVGLDNFHGKDEVSRRTQRDFFRTQIQLSINLNLPLVIHCRDAFEDLFEILRDFPRIHGRFLVHCFTGGIDELEHIQNLGGYVAFGGVSTYKNALNVQEAVVAARSDRFVFETDLPFLSPVPKRGEVCKPEYIRYVAQHISRLKGISEEEIWNQTRENLRNLFGV